MIRGVIPDDWVVEGFAPEGPKITRHGDYYYMITAVGGTAGPPTGHMVIAARSKSIHGPWENCPANPIVRTTSAAEKWWSRGHATLVEGPAGDWWSVYHGYENGYWTLGRQALLDPIEWTDDGWFRMTGGDLSQPIAKPQGRRGGAARHGAVGRFLDAGARHQMEFLQACGRRAQPRARREWRAAAEGARQGAGRFVAAAADRGRSGLSFECDIEIAPGGTAGLILFYDDRLYCGLGFDGERFVTHQYGIERARPANPHGRTHADAGDQRPPYRHL